VVSSFGVGRDETKRQGLRNTVIAQRAIAQQAKLQPTLTSTFIFANLRLSTQTRLLRPTNSHRPINPALHDALTTAIMPDVIDPRMMSVQPRIRYNTIGGINGPLVVLDNVRRLR
jgi:hypothetical protein